LSSYLESLWSHGVESLAACICIGLGVAAAIVLIRGATGDSDSFDDWDSPVACRSPEACKTGELLQTLKEMGTIAAGVAAVPFLIAQWVMVYRALIKR